MFRPRSHVISTVRVGDNARKGFCPPEEVERVIDHLPDHAKPIVRTLYLTGWRTGEVLGLRWAQVDFEAGTFRLDAAQTKTGKPCEFPFGQLPALAELFRGPRWQAPSGITGDQVIEHCGRTVPDGTGSGRVEGVVIDDNHYFRSTTTISPASDGQRLLSLPFLEASSR